MATMVTTTRTTANITRTRILCACAAAACALLTWQGMAAQEKSRIDSRITENVEKAVYAPATPDRLQALQNSKKQLAEKLYREPVDAEGWMWMSYLRLATQNDRAGALGALRMSQKIAPYDPSLMLNRAFSFYNLRDLHTDADRQIMISEWRGAFKAGRPAFIARVSENPGSVEDIEAALKAGDGVYYKRWLIDRKAAGL